ncbi:hypothetical protein P810_03246, partial [Escherichia coli BIDMC 49a]
MQHIPEDVIQAPLPPAPRKPCIYLFYKDFTHENCFSEHLYTFCFRS